MNVLRLAVFGVSAFVGCHGPEAVNQICCNLKTTVQSLDIEPLGPQDPDLLVAGCSREVGPDEMGIGFYLRHGIKELSDWCREMHPSWADRKDLQRRHCDYIYGQCWEIRVESERSVVKLSQGGPSVEGAICLFGEGVVGDLVGHPKYDPDPESRDWERAFILTDGAFVVNELKPPKDRFTYFLVFEANPTYRDALSRFGLDEWMVVISARCECELWNRRSADQESCYADELWNVSF